MDSDAQNMPSANAFADMFKAAMAPVLGHLMNLNENVSSVPLNGYYDSNECGETASNDRQIYRYGCGFIRAPRLCGQRPLEGTRTGLNSKREDFSQAAIFNNLLSEKMGDEKLKTKLNKYPRP